MPDGIKTTVTKQTIFSNADPKSSLSVPAVSPALSSSSGSPTDKLEALNSMLKKGLITQKDYDLKKAEILKSM